MEFNPNGALIDFYQARVWNIVNKHINFVFSAVWLVLLIFQVFGDNPGSLRCRPDHLIWIIFVLRGAEFSKNYHLYNYVSE